MSIDVEFDARLRRIDQDRARMVHGYDAIVSDEGLIVFRSRKPSTRLPLRGLVMTLGIFVAFKVAILLVIGGEEYLARIAPLAEGSAFERLAAVALSIDPLTDALASLVGNTRG